MNEELPDGTTYKGYWIGVQVIERLSTPLSPEGGWVAQVHILDGDRNPKPANAIRTEVFPSKGLAFEAGIEAGKAKIDSGFGTSRAPAVGSTDIVL